MDPVYPLPKNIQIKISVWDEDVKGSDFVGVGEIDIRGLADIPNHEIPVAIHYGDGNKKMEWKEAGVVYVKATIVPDPIPG